MDEGHGWSSSRRAYELKSFGVDEDRSSVAACAVFTATHTGRGGPVPPTGKGVVADYAYVMEFDGGQIRHATKIWNDAHSLAARGGLRVHPI